MALNMVFNPFMTTVLPTKVKCPMCSHPLNTDTAKPSCLYCGYAVFHEPMPTPDFVKEEFYKSTAIADGLKYHLEKYLPIRTVFRLDESGIFLAMFEANFQLVWDPNRARIFSGVSGISAAEAHAKIMHGFVVDPFEHGCPVRFDWQKWLVDNDVVVSDLLAKNASYYILD
jgi:hypothetical protein